MYKKRSVNIVIPAYNESKNIRSILQDVLAQQKQGFHLLGIHIISDGSTDNTSELAKGVNKLVKIHKYHTRKGKAFRLNQFFLSNKADIIVVIDADQRLKDDKTIKYLLSGFTQAQVGLVCSNVVPIISPNLFSKISYFGYLVWDRARNYLGTKGIRYHVDGGMLAYSHNFANLLKFPVEKGYIDDDSFSFFKANELSFQVRFVKNAISYTKLPTRLRDYLSQMVRYMNADKLSQAHFDQALIAKFNNLDFPIKFNAFIKEFTRSPLYGLLYILLETYTKIFVITHKPSNRWAIAESTK